MREDSEGEFKKIFAKTTNLGQQLHGDHFELSTPRIVGRQMQRSNPDISNPEDYFRITLYHEFLSHVVSELQSRFVDNPAHDIVLDLLYLLPSECINKDSVPKELAQAVELYKDNLPHSVILSTEYSAWIRKWKQSNKSDLPNKLVDSLHACSDLQFPNLHVLLQIVLSFDPSDHFM